MSVPYRRQNDPPEGSLIARWSDALRPWLPITALITAVCSFGALLMVAFGFTLVTPGDTVSQNSARLDTLEVRLDDIQQRAAKDALLTMALVRSKCLELDVGSRALSVLPCDEVGVRQAVAYPAPLPYVVSGTIAQGMREPIPPPEHDRPREYAHPAGRGWGIVLADEPLRSGP